MGGGKTSFNHEIHEIHERCRGGGRFCGRVLLGKGKIKVCFTPLRALLVGSSWDAMGVNLKKVEQILLSSDRWSGEWQGSSAGRMECGTDHSCE